ncbi:VanZ family protein [Hyphomonas sp. WL0036]|uniref:VanZ family protein n=1 Tax=Hyphomonas sediminis TaxID=2866160 RepID=UPI001C816120|nr:VanZ family protein [Hyphomonas sediminis]MBY9066654.1 VanZ family protein [Hyphomonas sediminis]
MPRPSNSLSVIRRLAAFAALVVGIIIAHLSLVPAGDVPAPQISDKIRHFAAYAGLAAPLALALHPKRWLAAAIAATAFGVALEFAQAMGEAGREGSALDALANMLGAFLGAGLIRISAGVRG